jgi:hypothetical protein
MSALARTSSAQFFIRALKSCALYREWNSGIGGSVDDSVRIVGKWKSKELEFQNEKLVSEEPTRMPRPPALLTAAARSGPVRNPIGAAKIGASIPSALHR